LLVGAQASAHSADVIYAELSGPGIEALKERVTMTAATLGTLAPVDANRDGQLTQAELDSASAAIETGVWDAMPLSAAGIACRRGDAHAFLREGYIELNARFICGPGALMQVFRPLAKLPANYRVVFDSEIAGSRFEAFATSTQPSVEVPGRGGAQQPASAIFGGFRLGLFHGFGAIDDLALLLAFLLVASSWRQVGGIVAGFALGHTLTMSAIAFRWLTLDASRERWAQIAMFLAIAYVAVENLFAKEPHYRPAMAAVVGLVHGLGFAGASSLTTIGVTLGVTSGQVAVAGVVYPLLRVARGRPAYRNIVRALSIAVICAAGFVLVQRLR
jgi:hypothetical protein